MPPSNGADKPKTAGKPESPETNPQVAGPATSEAKPEAPRLEPTGPEPPVLPPAPGTEPEHIAGRQAETAPTVLSSSGAGLDMDDEDEGPDAPEPDVYPLPTNMPGSRPRPGPEHADRLRQMRAEAQRRQKPADRVRRDETVPGGAYILGARLVNAEGEEIEV